MLRTLYFTAALLALGSTATQAQVSSASKAFSFDFGPIPTEMTDGTLYLTNLAGETIEIYDETLTRIKTINAPGEPYSVRYLDMTSGYEYDNGFFATQTVFNTDDAFEYIRPSATVTNGVDIVSETGEVIQSVSAADSFVDVDIAKVGKTFYLVFVREEELLFHAINPVSASIERVPSRIKTRVRSSVVSRSEQLTVETEESGAPRTLVVTSTAGETMLKQPIAAGQTSVQVDASRLSPGVNIVNVSGDRENATSCKVIVK